MMKIGKATALQAIAGFAGKDYLTKSEKIALMEFTAKAAL